jgi:rare lipoprotein A
MPRPGAAWLVPLALIALSACSRPVLAPPGGPPISGLPRFPGALPGESSVPPVRPGDEQAGLASWYGEPYHGRRTASGEVYDMHDLTAAHRSLPFGARVVVVNRGTEGSVEVRINDRGPFVEGRIIDLSYAAARAVGGIGPGVIPALVRVVSVPAAASPRPAGPDAAVAYAVQVGSFVDRARASDLRDAIERDLGPAKVAISEVAVGGETRYRVRVGVYPDREAARTTARRLAERGYPGIVVER